MMDLIHFRKMNYLKVNKKEIELIDIPGLEALISNSGDGE